MFINRNVYDIIGIGIGPFNLGMAALLESIPRLDCLFFDQSPEFQWHEGLLLTNARLQVPFFADLVTVVDPCSRFTYLNYLKEQQRLFRFAIHENNFITRKEYNSYCRWVATKLNTLRFSHKVVDVCFEPKEDVYQVMIHNMASKTIEFYYARHLVMGIGTEPYWPDGIHPSDAGTIIHAADYMRSKKTILEKEAVSITGSGQSAAEIFYDLLQEHGQRELRWYTRSPRFFPMEYSKLSLEMTSPDYIDHFYSLPFHQKKAVLQKQDMLYKGINFSLINEIYDALYVQDYEDGRPVAMLYPNCSLHGYTATENSLVLKFFHSEQEKEFEHPTEALIVATGYQQRVPLFLESIKELLFFLLDGRFDVQRDYSVGKNLFVQNAELHTHGFSAPDLGMGPYRNATILNAILRYEHFVMERQVAFQRFGV